MSYVDLCLYTLCKCLLKYKCSYHIYIYVAHCDFHVVRLKHIHITYTVYIFKGPQSQGTEKRNHYI